MLSKNPLIQKELDLNSQLSQYLLEQTEKTNTLTQDELRMRNVLDNLTQTQRTIDEQISALQGTLVLSRIIQQQNKITDQLKYSRSFKTNCGFACTDLRYYAET